MSVNIVPKFDMTGAGMNLIPISIEYEYHTKKWCDQCSKDFISILVWSSYFSLCSACLLRTSSRNSRWWPTARKEKNKPGTLNSIAWCISPACSRTKPMNMIRVLILGHHSLTKSVTINNCTYVYYYYKMLTNEPPSHPSLLDSNTFPLQIWLLSRLLAVSRTELTDTSFTVSREFVIVRGCLRDNSMKLSTQSQILRRSDATPTYQRWIY